MKRLLNIVSEKLYQVNREVELIEEVVVQRQYENPMLRAIISTPDRVQLKDECSFDDG